MNEQLSQDSNRWVRYMSAGLAILIVASVVWSISGGGAVGETELRTAIHKEINEERKAEGVNTLKMSEKMSNNANAYSARMAEEGWFSHDPPSGKKDMVNCPYRGENLIKQSDTIGDPDQIASELVSSWMASEKHKQNILDGGYGRQGIGVSVDNQIIVTQRLCG